MKKPKSGIHQRPKDLEKLLDGLVDEVNANKEAIDELKAKAEAKAEKENPNEKG